MISLCGDVPSVFIVDLGIRSNKRMEIRGEWSDRREVWLANIMFMGHRDLECIMNMGQGKG